MIGRSAVQPCEQRLVLSKGNVIEERVAAVEKILDSSGSDVTDNLGALAVAHRSGIGLAAEWRDREDTTKIGRS
jgi:hypothetical protein